jgi:hypothetical protein
MVCMTKLVVLFLAGLKVTDCTLRGSKGKWGGYKVVPAPHSKGYDKQVVTVKVPNIVNRNLIGYVGSCDGA